MNDKSRMILKMLAGGYILYIGISLLIGVLQTEPNEKVLMIIISIFFMAVGGTVLYFSVRALLKEYGVDIEFWKRKHEDTAVMEDGKEEDGEEMERKGSKGASHVELQNLSDDGGESKDQQEDDDLDTAAMPEADCVQENDQEESVEEAQEEDAADPEELRKEEQDAVQEDQSVEEEWTEEDETSAEEAVNSRENTVEEQTDIEAQEDLSEQDLSEETQRAESDPEGQQEEKKEANPSEKFFRRRQASISPMPQRRS